MRSLVVVLSLLCITLTVACSRTGLLAAPDGGDEGGSTGVFVIGGATSSGGATGITIDTTNSAGGTSSTGGIFPMAGSFSEGGTGGGGTGGSSTSLTGNCANLTCVDAMTTLLSTCQVGATDTCTQQVSMSSAIVMNECYSNGVKMQISAGMDMSSMTATVKSGTSVCYSMLVGGLTGNVMTIVVRDGSGTTVGTMAQDSTTGLATITCPGGAPTIDDGSCGVGNMTSTGTVPGGGASCSTGICRF